MKTLLRVGLILYGVLCALDSRAQVPQTVDHTAAGPIFSVNSRKVTLGEVVVGGRKMDSLTVTNTGTTALLMSSVKSTDSAFTITGGSAVLAATASTKFYVTFLPAVTGTRSASLLFLHNAPTSPDTVAVSGTGTMPGFAMSRKSLPFGNLLPGNSKTDSVIITNTGTGALNVGTIISNTGSFGISPSSATIAATVAKTFYVTFAPTTSGSQYGIIIFTHNAPSARDTLIVAGAGAGAGGAGPPAPVLVGPANGSLNQPVSGTLSWAVVSGATGYGVQLTTDSTFHKLLISDSMIVAANRAVSGLAENTMYFWRAIAKNSAGWGTFSPIFSFTTVSSALVSGTVSFSGDVSSTAYRMFGMPGVSATTAGDLVSGTPLVDWRLLRDNGRDLQYPNYYEDLSVSTVLNPGEGYWLLQKSNVSISRTVILPQLKSDGTFNITLHSGWNMISSPFYVNMLRSAVITANGLPGGTVFWEHISGTRTSSGTLFEPFKGYYFDNSTTNLTSLKIPYPFGGTLGKVTETAGVDWRMELIFESDINKDRDNYIGVAPSLSEGRNELDQHEPPLIFDQGFLYFVRPQWDSVYDRFSTDIRPGIGEGQAWDFEVWNPRKKEGRISFQGIEAVPAQYEIRLINLRNTTPVDMRQNNDYRFQTVSAKTQFRLLIGSKQFVEEEAAKVVPEAYGLVQNYPNPFNGTTMISYTIPALSYVRLEIVSVLGQRVRLLEEGYRSPSAYSVAWDGRDDARQAVASGVYFYRLTANASTVATRKMIMVK